MQWIKYLANIQNKVFIMKLSTKLLKINYLRILDILLFIFMQKKYLTKFI